MHKARWILPGGHLIVAALNAMFDDVATEYSALDWESFKLPRGSRSSLNAETQAAATAADALESVKTCWGLLKDPTKTLLDPALQLDRRSALVVDAKSLYEALHKESINQGAACKRTAVEQFVMRRSLEATASAVR